VSSVSDVSNVNTGPIFGFEVRSVYGILITFVCVLSLLAREGRHSSPFPLWFSWTKPHMYTNTHPSYSGLEDGGSMYLRNVWKTAHLHGDEAGKYTFINWFTGSKNFM
jgi:hypothetical protein